MKSSLKIAIPFHNSVEWLDLCIESIINTGFSTEDIVICDDGSDYLQNKIAKEILKKYSIKNKILKNRGRRGYGGACNYLAENIDTKYVLFLNTDCLIGAHTVTSLIAPMEIDDTVIMSCPVSNNSPNYTFPIPDGMNYLNFSNFLYELYSDNINLAHQEAATIVGNCLLINRKLFNNLGGFSDEWGIGYGEETDLQFRALKNGYKSIVCLNSYVYHFGGGSFNEITNIEKIRNNNNLKFKKKWGLEYKSLIERQKFNPINLLNFLSKEINRNKIEYDALFYLPIIDQESGGNHNIIDACNELIRAGFNVNCVLVGNTSDRFIENYKEMMLFKPLRYNNDDAFINDSINLKINKLISGLHTSAKVFSAVKCAKHYQYIQGVEYMFESGLGANECLKSYKIGHDFIFASHYLKRKISPLLSHVQSSYVIPPFINDNIFYRAEKKRRYHIGMCLRGVPDKGQGFLINLLLNDNIKNSRILILGSPKYEFLRNYFKNIEYVVLPLSRSNLSKYLRDVSNYIDLSSHEGYGLMGHEAIKSGAKLFYTNYGGISDYVDIEDEFLISDPFDSNLILRKVKNSKNINKLKNTNYNSWISIFKE